MVRSYVRALLYINTKKYHGKISVRINLSLFSTVVPASIFMFLSCRPFVVITTLSTGLVGVDNVVITTKGLQDDGGK